MVHTLIFLLVCVVMMGSQCLIHLHTCGFYFPLSLLYEILFLPWVFDFSLSFPFCNTCYEQNSLESGHSLWWVQLCCKPLLNYYFSFSLLSVKVLVRSVLFMLLCWLQAFFKTAKWPGIRISEKSGSKIATKQGRQFSQ